MPVSASYDEVGPIVGGRGGQLVRYRPVGIEHGLDADLDAVAAKVGLDVRKVRLCLRFQQVFGDFDERGVLGSLQEGQRALDRAARFAGVLPGKKEQMACYGRGFLGVVPWKPPISLADIYHCITIPNHSIYAPLTAH
jgi:hypothetical protein